MQLKVTDVKPLNGKDNYYDFPEDYEVLTGYSCYTPVGELVHLQQYRIELEELNGGKKYELLSVGYDTGSRFQFEIWQGSVTTIDHVPYIGEVFDCDVIWASPPTPEDGREVRIIPIACCCVPREDGISCYCAAVLPYQERHTQLRLVGE